MPELPNENRPADASALLSILMYHQVGRFSPMREHRANYCDSGRFARQMTFLARGGFRVLSIEDVLAGLNGQRPWPARSVLLTFDDAYAGFMEHALPVLEHHGYPAVVYAISGWIGGRMRWAGPAVGRAQPALMSAEQLRRARFAGITIGSHSASHAKLGELDRSDQRRELTESRAALEDALGAEVVDLCYPFGSFARATLELAAEAGYRSAMTCLRGAVTAADHPLLLPRKAISFGDNLVGFGWKLLAKQAPKPALAQWRRDLAATPLDRFVASRDESGTVLRADRRAGVARVGQSENASR